MGWGNRKIAGTRIALSMSGSGRHKKQKGTPSGAPFAFVEQWRRRGTRPEALDFGHLQLDEAVDEVLVEHAAVLEEGAVLVEISTGSPALCRHRAIRRAGAVAGRSSIVDTPAAIFTPVCACTDTGCIMTVRSEPPTRTLAPAPAPTVPPAVAPV